MASKLSIMYLVGGASGSGKSTFCKWIVESMYHPAMVFAQAIYYDERDYLRNEIGLLEVGIEDPSDVPRAVQLQSYVAADAEYERDLEEVLSRRASHTVVEWPFHNKADLDVRIAQADQYHYTPQIHICFAGGIQTTLNRDIARRARSFEQAASIVESGRADEYVHQNLSLQSKIPSVFNACVAEGKYITLWDTSKLNSSNRIAHAENDKLEIYNKTAYDIFQMASRINPEAPFMCHAVDEKDRYLQATLQPDGLFLPPDHTERGAGLKDGHTGWRR